ncbi:hypothetical protein H0N96_00690 [Candidatus Micrarchaeota archaeon]|nr:hypothetical protein [Candidatus Micrarchaeota archaeon]
MRNSLTRGKRAQIALWMLTKFAMIFFILALALILLGYSGAEKTTLCVTRAQGLASAIRSNIANVLTAPVEDERKVIPLERVLSIGQSDYVKYGITITNRIPGGDQPNSLIIEVVPTGAKDCNGGGNVAYPKEATLVYGGFPAGDKEKLELDPYGGIAGAERSWYLVILKCKTKYWQEGGPKEYIYLDNCRDSQLIGCIDFAQVEKCCGWPASGVPDCP